MARFYLLLPILALLAGPASAQGVNTTTGKPVSPSGEPASTVRPPPPPLPPATSVLSNQDRYRLLHRRQKRR